MSKLSSPLLSVIAGDSAGEFVELRWAMPRGGMRRAFFPTPNGLSTAAQTIETMGAKTDLFVGAAPRFREGGGKADVAHAWSLWIDIDHSAWKQYLARLDCQPTLIILSGSGGVHAWWKMATPIPAALVEVALRRLWWLMSDSCPTCNGADPECKCSRNKGRVGADWACTEVARIMRPPGSRNWKHDPPSPVSIASETSALYSPSMVADLSDPPTTGSQTNRGHAPRVDAEDRLLGISPMEYVPRLTGREVNGGGYITCPFHGGGSERTPSLKVYDDPERGWRCFGCDLGGSVYDLGGELFGMSTRGVGFVQLRERLEGALL